MKVTNRTVWRTDQLKRILLRVAREEFENDPGRVERLKVEIRYTRTPFGGCSGFAWYNSNSSVIRVPNPHSKSRRYRLYVKEGVRFPSVDFAYVAAHEFAHNRNVRHEDMKLHHRRGAYTNEHFAWAKEIVVEQQVAPKKPTLDAKRAKQLKTAEANVAKYQRRIKLDQTLLKKWSRKVKTLEKRIAAGAELAMAAQGLAMEEVSHEPSADNLG